jgi:hypothetical protein
MMRLRLLLSALLCLSVAATLQPSFAAGEAPVLVGVDGIDNPIDPEAQAAWNAAGLDIRELYIHQPDFDVPELEFIIQLESLDSPPPGEVVRYLWSFVVDGVEYGINAKVSDVVSVVTPTSAVETVEHAAAGSSFRLRTGCLVTQIATCAHIMWLDGTFDADADQVRITVPIGDPRIPGLGAGATIEPAAGGAQACLQAVVTNAQTCDTALQDEPYEVPA